MNVDTLAIFQDAFAAALRGAETSRLSPVTAQPGFAVYRNTVMKACIDALAANYPCVRRLVGEDWFTAAAGLYASTHPAHTPVLLHYGADFARFLADFEPAAELPYLPGVAKLDRFWTEAHVASDEPVLDASVLASADEAGIEALLLRPHAAARWTWFPHCPVVSIWSRNRFDGTVDLSDIAWRGEGVLFTRPGAIVQVIPLDRPGCAFLDACGAGRCVQGAVSCALDADSAVDLSDLIARLLASGAFGCTDSKRTLA
jgi:Putative DNA-binding domain